MADEVAKNVARRLPSFRRSKSSKKKINIFENAVFLDTSAIIDGRIFDVIHLGLFRSNIIILESILLELKHIADSKDLVKRERGRKGSDAALHAAALRSGDTSGQTESGKASF